jgi:hypothetical protein
MSTGQTKPKTAAAPSPLVAQRQHVAALESERATLAARLRQAAADNDAALVQSLMIRRETLPVLLADGRAALVPLEVAAVEAELDAVAARLAAQRVTVEEADRARETARAAYQEAERRYGVEQASFLPLTTARQFLLQRRRELQAQPAVRACAVATV